MRGFSVVLKSHLFAFTYHPSLSLSPPPSLPPSLSLTLSLCSFSPSPPLFSSVQFCQCKRPQCLCSKGKNTWTVLLFSVSSLFYNIICRLKCQCQEFSGFEAGFRNSIRTTCWKGFSLPWKRWRTWNVNTILPLMDSYYICSLLNYWHW